jgi:uncharacterized protein YebE (UPF0316 family)
MHGMELLASLPTWATALLVFSLRIVDVSFGTLRTFAVVQGRLKLSVLLGFLETFVWLTAVAQALLASKNNWLLIVAYCAGFAAGNAVGIQIERKLALGVVVVRMFSAQAGGAIAAALGLKGWKPTTFQGIGADGPNTLIYVTCPRRDAASLLSTAQAVDPHVYYSLDLVREYYGGIAGALRSQTVGRSILRKK